MDVDVSRFGVDTLRRWKQQAEAYAVDAIGVVAAGTRPSRRQPLLLCAFDLDGTLLRGPAFKYSWAEVWRRLGYSDDMRRRLFRRYNRGSLSYEDWCAECAEYFRRRNLDRNLFSELAAVVRPTEHMRDGLAMLRAEGVVLGVISGGIDALLRAIVPDYDALFDFVHVNRFEFAEDGRFVRVTPTAFDFEHKLTALETEATARGMRLDNCVFVGEGANDEHLVRTMRSRGVGLTIAYPPSDTGVETWADHCVEDDDLRRVAELVLARD